jgi:hypothetical protein
MQCDLPIIKDGCAATVAYLIVWLHELDGIELADVATVPEFVTPNHPTTAEVRDHVLNAWQDWSMDHPKDATRGLGRALVIMLGLSVSLMVDVERELESTVFDTRKRYRGKHPDTW